jgi:hypothetical protein
MQHAMQPPTENHLEGFETSFLAKDVKLCGGQCGPALSQTAAGGALSGLTALCVCLVVALALSGGGDSGSASSGSTVAPPPTPSGAVVPSAVADDSNISVIDGTIISARMQNLKPQLGVCVFLTIWPLFQPLFHLEKASIDRANWAEKSGYFSEIGSTSGTPSSAMPSCCGTHFQQFLLEFPLWFAGDSFEF